VRNVSVWHDVGNYLIERFPRLKNTTKSFHSTLNVIMVVALVWFKAFRSGLVAVTKRIGEYLEVYAYPR